MLELNQLQAFLAVADHHSFSAAAEQLHLTQPAISKRISALETRVDQVLFDRIGRHITLTEAGEVLYPHALALLAQAEDLQRRLNNLGEHISGTLSIGISHHIGLHRLPPILKRYCKHYPDVELAIQFVDSEQAYDAVLSGKMELGIVTLPADIDTPIQAHTVWQDSLVIVTDNNHPLQHIKHPSMKDLANYPAILPNSSTFTRKIISHAFQTKKSQLKVGIETNYLETNRMLISIGLGWGVLPEKMITKSVSRLDVKHLNLSRPLGYIRHKDRSLSNAANAMIELLNQEEKDQRLL